MAATLPPINSKNGAKKVPSYAESLRGSPSGRLKPLSGGSRKEKELQEKRMKLRALQHDLTKEQTAVYRNTYRHNLCLDMLKEGFHLSFRELFNLIHQQLAERERRGPESLMWTQIMLENEHEKLDNLKKYLTEAETAQRNDDYTHVYECRYQLAHYFQRIGDKWLADHFFQTCLEMSQHITSDDGGKMKALGECNVGFSLEENDENFEAAEHFEEYYNLSKDHKDDWIQIRVDGSEMSYYTEACICLYRIYTTIGKQLETEDPELALGYLLKAYEKAAASGDTKLKGEAAYKLGLAYEKSGHVATALLHLNHFLDTCKASGDKEGMGRACDAIAKAYNRQGNKEQSIAFLKEFVQLAEDSGMDDELSQACHNLGSVLNSMGRYREATEYFTRAYNISRAVGEGPAIHINRVQCGIAQAHNMLKPFSAHVVRGDTPCLQRILEWKSVRQSCFSDPIPEQGRMGSPRHAEAVQEEVPLPEPDDAEGDTNQSGQNSEREASPAPEEGETRESTATDQ